jgi:hypothetical protein
MEMKMVEKVYSLNKNEKVINSNIQREEKWNKILKNA